VNKKVSLWQWRYAGGEDEEALNKEAHHITDVVLVTVPRASRSCEHFPDGFDLHLLQRLTRGMLVGSGGMRAGRTRRRSTKRRTRSPKKSRAKWTLSRSPTFFFFFTLVTGPRRSLSLKLSDTRVYEPQLRASRKRTRSPTKSRAKWTLSRSSSFFFFITLEPRVE